MQWSRAPNAGFTTGKSWEPLQPDTLSANVEAEDADSTSLLNLYRRLIHLRAENSALGSGEVIPLTTNEDAVAAYLRRDRGRTVLVVVNLGNAAVAGATLSFSGPVLRPGRYRPSPLLGKVPVAPLRIGADGQILRYAPVSTLAPMQGYVIELIHSR
jgi:glycosidase